MLEITDSAKVYEESYDHAQEKGVLSPQESVLRVVRNLKKYLLDHPDQTKKLASNLKNSSNLYSDILNDVVIVPAQESGNGVVKWRAKAAQSPHELPKPNNYRKELEFVLVSVKTGAKDLVLCSVNSAGEILNVTKKTVRKQHGINLQSRRDFITLTMGTVGFFTAVMAVIQSFRDAQLGSKQSPHEKIDYDPHQPESQDLINEYFDQVMQQILRDQVLSKAYSFQVTFPVESGQLVSLMIESEKSGYRLNFQNVMPKKFLNNDQAYDIATANEQSGYQFPTLQQTFEAIQTVFRVYFNNFIIDCFLNEHALQPLLEEKSIDLEAAPIKKGILTFVQHTLHQSEIVQYPEHAVELRMQDEVHFSGFEPSEVKQTGTEMQYLVTLASGEQLQVELARRRPPLTDYFKITRLSRELKYIVDVVTDKEEVTHLIPRNGSEELGLEPEDRVFLKELYHYLIEAMGVLKEKWEGMGGGE